MFGKTLTHKSLFTTLIYFGNKHLLSVAAKWTDYL